MLVYCPICGKQYDNGEGFGRFCSKECRHKYDSEKRKEYLKDYIPPDKPPKEKTPKTCPFCGKVFIPPHRQDQTYCSDVCRDKAKWEKKKRILTERICPICEKVFMPTVNKQVCCSPECASKKIYLEKGDVYRSRAKQWRLNNPERSKENDRRKKEKNPELYKQIEREYHDKTRFSGNKAVALERDSNRCSECGAEIRLAGHHIDGSGQTENRNDDPDNLQILCPSCHGKKQKGIPKKPEIHLNVTCQGCGIEFSTTQERINSGRGKFHSTECFNNSKKKRIPLICEHCGIEFSVTPSRLKRGMVKYHNAECRKAAGYAWTKYSRTEYNEQQKALQ